MQRREADRIVCSVHQPARTVCHERRRLAPHTLTGGRIFGPGPPVAQAATPAAECEHAFVYFPDPRSVPNDSMTRTTLSGSTLVSLSGQLGPSGANARGCATAELCHQLQFSIRARHSTRDEATGLHGLPYLAQIYGRARPE